MWREMARIIHEVRPRFAFVENSPMLTSRGLGTVLGDLAAMGFDARWGVLGAADVGANHQRDRIWIVGKATNNSQIRPCREASKQKLGGFRLAKYALEKKWWFTEPDQTPVEIERSICGMDDGLASRVDEIIAIGNGQVPLCAATAWRILGGQQWLN
jgi:DNA (cytosine-5)-methyltransferase 1